ncbi:MAG: low-specificity L-threonine aldolase [Ahrensia sp.]|nr:low-specificity L-threonine aldolase [Ahrensia sp.]
MYEAMTRSAQGLIDLRSDTVTRPTAGMREAMASAQVGDDVYGDDPTVRALEERVADLLGKEDAVFVASGTQSNLTALLSHCGRGDEYIGGVGYHIPTYEAAGAAVLGGISPRHLKPDESGALDPDDIAATVAPDDPHFAITKLLCLENTFNGKVVPQAKLEAAAQVARANGLSVHVDGARLMNAVIASNAKADAMVAFADSVSLCLSKGLGAPVGSVLSGSRDFIRRAYRSRKLLGGGMRQAGVLAACGLYALDHHVDRLAEDHIKARTLAQRLAAIDGIEIDESAVQTNMIWLTVSSPRRMGLADHLRKDGIVAPSPDPRTGQMRMVVHLDISREDIDIVVQSFSNWLDS